MRIKEPTTTTKKKQDHLQAMRWKVAQHRRGPGTNGPGVLREEATSGLVLSREREQRVPGQTTQRHVGVRDSVSQWDREERSGRGAWGLDPRVGPEGSWPASTRCPRQTLPSHPRALPSLLPRNKEGRATAVCGCRAVGSLLRRSPIPRAPRAGSAWLQHVA